jgi:glycosyltransferase involved in cell wall biosynthesis
MKKVAFLFTRPRKGQHVSKNHFYGMYGLRDHGFDTTYLEIEQCFPMKACAWLRKHLLNMHFVHLPLFPLFFKYDIIFTSTAYSSMVIKAMLKSIGIKAFKWILLDFNIIGTIGEGKTFRQKLFKWAISKVDGIVAISEAEKQGLQKMFPHLKDKIIFIHEATDLELFQPGASPFLGESAVIGGRGVSGQVLAVGTYGRDWRTLVDAVRDTDIQLTIATKPRLVKELEPLPPNVQAKLFTPDEMKALYEKAAVVVVPIQPKENSFDSVGTLSIGEAMAMAKPVIVSKTLNMDSYITDGENGVFVEPGNSEDMRKKIQDLLNDQDGRERIGRNALRYAQTTLSDGNFSKHLANFLNKL